MQESLFRYQNFHRPCFFPETIIDGKGKCKKRYPYDRLMTPFEKLLLTEGLEQHLNHSVTIESLKAYAYEFTDERAAQKLLGDKHKLFSKIFNSPAA